MDPMKPFEVPTDMRKFAEQSVEQARQAFDGFISAAHQAVSDMEGRAHAARSGVMEMSGRAMTFAERNMAGVVRLREEPGARQGRRGSAQAADRLCEEADRRP